MTPAHDGLAAILSVGSAAYALFLLALLDVVDGRDPVRTPTSAYADGRHAQLYVDHGLSSVVAHFALSVAVMRVQAGWLPGLLALAGFVRLGILLWQTDPETTARTTYREFRFPLAMATYLPACGTVALGTPLALRSGPPSWDVVWNVLQWLVAAGTASLAATMAVPALHRYAGLSERVTLVSTLAWLAGLGVALAGHA